MILLPIVCWENTEQATKLLALWWLVSDDFRNPGEKLELFAQSSQHSGLEVWNSFLRMPLLMIACRLWHWLFCAGNKWWAKSYQQSKRDDFKDRSPMKHTSKIPSIPLPLLAADASFSKFSSCNVSTLPLLPDCYHNSFALYHQNISSYLHSKKIAISSVPLAILHWKGRGKCSAFLVSNVVSLQGNHLLILYHLSVAFC